MPSELGLSKLPGSTSPDTDIDLGWDALQVCLAVYLLTSVGRLHVLFPAFGLFKPTMLSALGALALFLHGKSRARRMVSINQTSARAVAAMCLWIMFTIPTSINRGRSFTLLADGFVQTALMYAVTAASIRGKKDLERLMFVYLIGGAVYSATIVTRFGGGGRYNNLYSYDANDYATWIVSVIPIAIYFVASNSSTFRRGVAIASLPIMMMGFAQSESRGGFLALGVTLAFLLVVGRSIPFRWKIGGAVGVALMLAISASSAFWERIGTLTELNQDYNSTSETGRIQIWKRGLGYFAMRPILGVGADNFSRAEGTLSPLANRTDRGVRWAAPHNSYLQVMVELGAPGLICFLVAIFAAGKSLNRVRKSKRASSDSRKLAEAVLASLIGFCSGAFFLSLAYSALLFTPLAFAVATYKISSLDVKSRPSRRSRAWTTTPPLRAAPK